MGRRSLFAVVDYIYMKPPYYSILQLDPEYPEQIKVDEKVRFDLPKEPRKLSLLRWLFSPPKGSSVDLYMVPNWMFEEGDTVKPSCGYKFNFSVGRFLPINLPEYYKEHACVVSLGGKIYLSSNEYSDDSYSGRRQTDFQCYDPVKDSWKPLEPFPCYPIYTAHIMATALWDDTILLNGGYAGIWAYDVKGNKWYPVEFADDRCQSIVRGIAGREAVVVGNTIYALTDRSVVVLSIEKNSIKKEGIGGNRLVFKCSLLSDKKVDLIFFEDDRAHERSRHLVHLGRKKFCVVQSCNISGMDRQPIQVTYIKSMKDNSLMVMDEYFHWAKIQHYGQHYGPYLGNDKFRVRLCFSLPKGVATPLKQGKSFNLHPYPKEDYASNPVQEEEIVTPVQEEIMTLHKDGLHATSELFQENDSSQTNIIDEQGHSVYVRNLPPNATVGQLEKGLKKFGPIKREGTRVGKNKHGKVFAYVEFESATSKQRAIKASTIIIEGYTSVILDKSSTGLTLGNKLKNHGEASGSKMTCGGHNGGGPRRPIGNKLKNHGEVSGSKMTTQWRRALSPKGGLQITAL